MREFYKKILFFSFLGKIRNRDRTFFLFIIISLIVQIIVTFLKVEATPFLLYGMYSQKIPPSSAIVKKEIFLDKNKIETFPVPKREMDLLYTNLDNYLAIKHNSGVDPFESQVEKKLPFLLSFNFYNSLKKKIYNTSENYKQFPVWLKEKCFAITQKKIDSIYLVQSTYQIISSPFSIKKLDSVILEKF